MSQTDRRYDGPPIQELKKEPEPIPPPPKFHNKKTKEKGPIITTDIYWGWQSYGCPFEFYNRRHRYRESPFVGKVATGRILWLRHVVNRLKVLIKRDVRSDILWLEDQATKAQVSPEFSSREGLMLWLEYEGFRRGWLKIRVTPFEHRDYRTKKVVRGVDRKITEV
jgi:hypothetical protein